MINWYTVKAKYNKEIIRDGEKDSKRANESFLLPAVSFTDAEARINKEIGQAQDSQLHVHAMSTTDITEVFRANNTNLDVEYFWYLCKIVLLPEVDEDEKATKIKQTYMVEATSFNNASNRVDEKLDDSMFNYEITNIALSPIVDVLHPELDKELSRVTVEIDAE